MLDDKDVLGIFERSETLAVCGMSRDKNKTAHRVPAYMKTRGYEVIPINPFADTIIGRKAYARVAEVPHAIDILNVFRPGPQVLPIVREAVQRRQEQGDIGVIWLQMGIYNDEAMRLARDAGVAFIQDKCIYVEYNRLVHT